ncbi:MAG: T9SS type A sorting domain-containing protein [Saprospiraceae bacterium]|nr:T9SS type A sorting domain-containing protein [Candidatus Vicinibacter affinis]MBK7304565.1 T9SS type A sorting domain-containing protein [Candidatus Vicinibacter affinis]MBK7696722.1 T9SS type A sorting domain-containing protein [Candidatus Vicinibacter affinis]MBP6172854.1 T9SS type A sorting domain-containing protein [Saprospiraceae bacterium]
MLSALLLLKTIILSSQGFQYFSILPDVGAVKNQSVFNGIDADSNYIYVMGSMLIKEDSVSRKKLAGYMTWVFDYSGSLISGNMMKDSSLEKIVKWGDVFSLYKNRTGVYDFEFYDPTSPTNPNGHDRTGRVDMHTGKILKQDKIPVPYPDRTDLVNSIMNEITWIDDTLVSTLLVTGRGVREQYIFEMDSCFRTTKVIKLLDIKPDTVENHCWIGKDKNGNYEIIANVIYLKDFNSTGFTDLVYKKYDSKGNLIKYKKVDTWGKNIGINGSFYYNIKRDNLGRFMIFAREIDPISIKTLIPYALYTSPEFDTLYKLQPMYLYPKAGAENPEHWTYYLEKLGGNRGYIAAASMLSSLLASPNYGALYKLSSNGDSLWHRKYQPVGWDNSRAWWMKFTQVKETPYQSFVVSAMVSDGSDGYVKAWLLHLDKDGCLVPGCDKVASNTDILSGEEKPFSFYPNPIVSNKLYILSKITAHSIFNLELSDLSGTVLHTSKFQPQQGAQYFMELPSEIPNGEYVLKIQGEEFSQVEKIVVIW